MDDGKRLNVNACNLEQMRAVVRQADANFVELYAAFENLRAAHEALIARLEHIGAGPT